MGNPPAHYIPGTRIDSIKTCSKTWKRANTWTCAFLMLIATSLGCSSSRSPTPPEQDAAKELNTKDVSDNDAKPEAELIAEAKRLFQAQMYSLSRDAFESIRDHFALGAYGNLAQIKIADTYYFNNEYNEAAKFYEGYIKSYPRSPDLPYVELQAARAHVHSASGTGRDRQPLEQALSIYDDMVKKYGTTPYGLAAQSERKGVVETLSEYDRLIIEFYRKRNNEAAVADREKQFKERWGR